MSDLVERLRGIYRVPINDGLGKVEGNLEPENEREFVRQFRSPPIQIEAADEIERLRGELLMAFVEPKQDSPASQMRGIDADVLRALKYVRRFLNPEDHDVSYVDDVIGKAEGRGLYAAKEASDHG